MSVPVRPALGVPADERAWLRAIRAEQIADMTLARRAVALLAGLYRLGQPWDPEPRIISKPSLARQLRALADELDPQVVAGEESAAA